MEFHAKEQSIAWFKDRYLEHALDLKRKYQRNPVWTARQKCSLIETILKGFPIPEVFVEAATYPDGRQVWGVIDGQQRIRAILQFIGYETDPREAEHSGFALDKLESESPWQDLRFEDLSPDDQSRFFGTRLAVRELEDATELEVRDMFTRLNKYLTPLNAQEIRHANYLGPFAQVAEGLTDSNFEYWADNRMVTPMQIRRMKDVEFVSQLLIGVMHGPQGGGKTIINGYYVRYDDEFPLEREAKTHFEKTLDAIKRILPNIKDTRWSNKTDFYTLFVALSGLLKTSHLTKPGEKQVRAELERFAEEVATRLGDERATVSDEVIEYVRAVQKGANDKKRRADRQAALLEVINGCFTAKASKR